MFSLLLRNLFFTILQPGVVTVLVPYYLIHRRTDLMPTEWTIVHCIGLLTVLSGLIIMLYCVLQFAIEGKGTLSPADPTRQLVVNGLYKYSRNPMYLGVLIVLIGEFIFYQQIIQLIYLVIVFIVFYLFVVFFEEPRLRKDFPNEYLNYFGKVRRWI
jgi:protein-S-isoprenylcysteine O-methyltransferase Ste14